MPMFASRGAYVGKPLQLSEELHTSSETLNPETVAHADLLDEVIKLETWLADMNQRQKEAVQPTFQFA